MWKSICFGKIACQDNVVYFRETVIAVLCMNSQVDGEEGDLEVEDVQRPLEQGGPSEWGP